MMITMAILPSLKQLQDFVAKVPSYPVSVRQLIQLASKTGSSKEIKDFYGAFPADQIFDSEEDLLARSEQVEILRSEDDMPKELERSPEEY